MEEDDNDDENSGNSNDNSNNVSIRQLSQDLLVKHLADRAPPVGLSQDPLVLKAPRVYVKDFYRAGCQLTEEVLLY